MRPFDRCPQRLLTGLGVAAALEQVEPLRDALQDLGRGEHAEPGGGQLASERQLVESSAELADRLVGFDLRANAEELYRLRLGQGRNGKLDLALDAQELPTGYKQLEVRAALKQL